jgi:hypothetical protein
MYSLLKFIFISLCTCYAHGTLAQYNNFNVRTAPFALLDVYSGSCLKVGLEFRVFGNNSMTLEGGSYLRNWNGMSNTKGHILEVGIRHYFSQEQNSIGRYIAVSGSYKEQSFEYRDSIMTSNPYFTEYKTQKYVTCVNVNFGQSYIRKQRILFDVYAGLGIRIKNIQSTLSAEEFELAQRYGDSQSLYFMVTPGKFIWPNVNLGLRIGYIIK